MAEHTQHSPLPWVQWAEHAEIYSGANESTPCSISGGDELRLVASCDDIDVPEDEQIANAKFIVRACNAHEELLAALQALCPDDAPCVCDDWMVTPQGSKCVYCNARAAIARATAEQAETAEPTRN